MVSRKRSALKRQSARFEAGLDSFDDVFARESERTRRTEQHKEAALRQKACSSKKRYSTRAQAQDAIVSCAEHGTTGLHCYRCEYCGGWHLTSKPQ